MNRLGKENKYDIFIENLTKEFSSIPNFDITQEGKGKIIFEFLIKRLIEIQSLKTLFLNSYLPSASKAVLDDLKELQASKYKSLIQLTKEDLKENYYETIRLGYISMFHKYENYNEELFEKAELLISDTSNNNLKLSDYIKTTFNIDLTKYWHSPSLKRINYICICNKHHDGYPRAKNKPKEFENLPENEKFKFTKEDLNADLEFLINHYTSTLRVIFNLALHKMICENITKDLDGIPEGKEKEDLIQKKNLVDKYAVQLADSLKKY